MRTTFILILGVILTLSCYGQTYQYLGKATRTDTLVCKVLKDSLTGTRFILDSFMIFITAINSNGDTLWRTDPWKDDELMEYRVKRPIIVYFNFGNNKWTDNKEVIRITYNNTQFGIVDKKTGKFTWFGQD